MSINSKMKAICDNIRLRTGKTGLLNLDQIAEAILTIGGVADYSAWVNSSVGNVYPPAQLPAEKALSGYDIDILASGSDNLYSYIDEVADNFPAYATKEILGKDASGKYDIARYVLASRKRCAWQKQNYPKMYAWKNGSELRYSTSVSPRIGDNLYSNPYISDKSTETVVVSPKAAVMLGKRYSLSGGAFKDNAGTAAVILPIPKSVTGDLTVTLVNMTKDTGYAYVYGNGNSNSLFDLTVHQNTSADNKVITLKNSDYNDGTQYSAVSKCAFVTFFVVSNGSNTQYANSQILINGTAVPFEISTTPTVASQESTTTVEVTSGKPVTAVNATNRSRTADGKAFVRYESGDVEPTVIYTDVSDSRNSNATITENSATYVRYPLGDLGADNKKLTPIFVYANEHGVSKETPATGNFETKMCALIASRFIRDLCSGANSGNPLYKYIKERCMLVVIPVANPFGFNLNVSGDAPLYSWADGYFNYNGVNINRNYDTPGWDVMNNAGNDGLAMGAYAGSENETQYVMNTLAESGAVVAMSLHGLGSWEGYCAHQGQNPDGTDYNQEKLQKVVAFIKNNYGYTLRYYDDVPCANMPAVTSKSPSYITQSGAYGGIVEFSPDDVNVSGWKQEMKAGVIENAYAQMLNLMAMWLSDYLEEK